MLRASRCFMIAASSLCLALAGCGDDGESSSAGETDAGTDSTSSSTTASSTSAATSTSSSSTATSSTSSTSGGSGSSSGSGGETTGGSSGSTGADEGGLSFFATSVGSGELGGNLGGLAGADAICQGLAEAVGSTRTWHAYLSTTEEDARDRIGSGPWFNAAGDMVAADVDGLHTDGLSNGDPQHILDENGDEVPGNEHDILTGSDDDGTLHPGGNTCQDWTSASTEDQARLGHSDIPSNPDFSPSWNNAHDSQGCSPGNLENTGGAGRLYCFAID